MTKLGAALLPLLLASTATTALAQSAPAAEPAPPPAPAAPAAPAAAGQPVVVVSPGPVVVTQPAAPAGAPAATAPAAPSTAPAGPPQNADWNDLNHINGQLVKVGETNDYKKSYKRTSISTNPIGWIIGSYGVSVSYGVTNNIAIRGDVGYLSNYLDENTTGFSVGVGAPIYLRRTYQGPFIEPGFAIMTVNRDNDFDYAGCDDCSSSSSVTVAGPQMLAGWHWTWDSGFNLSAAFGLGRNWSSDDSYSKIFPNGYFRVGYAF